jgi:type VI secretion system secreted protein VgrG
MGDDLHVTMTLTVSDSPDVLQVIGINGQDGLNTLYRFDVDLVSRDALLDCPGLLQREAYLTFGNAIEGMQGVHGRIFEARQLYRGTRLSLYRVSLMPSLQALAAKSAPRSFNNMSALQIIKRLLSDHGLPDSAKALDSLTGIYPPRGHCLQYDESDLHLLQRLCEEEGIGFYFEHQQDRHLLRFCDDPFGFPEWPQAVRVPYIAERLSMQHCYSSHAGELYVPPMTTMQGQFSEADNQPFFTEYPSDTPPEWRWQVRARQLEQLRCERRQIAGRSTSPSMRSGRVVRIEGQQEAQFNDQWLVTAARHVGTQWAPLAAGSLEDVTQILAMTGAADRLPASSDLTTRPPPAARAHYANGFDVIPWAMPYRPSLKHEKPYVECTLLATQVCDAPDRQGRIRIRYDWQGADADAEHGDSWARTLSSAPRSRQGTRLKVTFLGGDPDQPLICGEASQSPSTGRPALRVRVDNIVRASADLHLQLEDRQCLQVESDAPLLLSSSGTRLLITEDSIHYSPEEDTATAMHQRVPLASGDPLSDA